LVAGRKRLRERVVIPVIKGKEGALGKGVSAIAQHWLLRKE